MVVPVLIYGIQERECMEVVRLLEELVRHQEMDLHHQDHYQKQSCKYIQERKAGLKKYDVNNVYIYRRYHFITLVKLNCFVHVVE